MDLQNVVTGERLRDKMFALQNLWGVMVGIYLDEIINIVISLVHLYFYLWKYLPISQRNHFSMKGCSDKNLEQGEVARVRIAEVVL